MNIHLEAPGVAVVFERVALPPEGVSAHVAERPADETAGAHAELHDVVALRTPLELDALTRNGIAPADAPHVRLGVVDPESGAVPVDSALLASAALGSGRRDPHVLHGATFE